MYVDGERVPYEGKLTLRMHDESTFDPPLRLAEGSIAEVWSEHGRLEARFVSICGEARDTFVMLTKGHW